MKRFIIRKPIAYSFFLFGLIDAMALGAALNKFEILKFTNFGTYVTLRLDNDPLMITLLVLTLGHFIIAGIGVWFILHTEP